MLVTHDEAIAIIEALSSRLMRERSRLDDAGDVNTVKTMDVALVKAERVCMKFER